MSLYLCCLVDINVTVPVLCGWYICHCICTVWMIFMSLYLYCVDDICHCICTVWMIYMSLYLYCVDDIYVTVPVLCG